MNVSLDLRFPLRGQLDRVHYHRSPVCGAALLAGALAWLDCRRCPVHEGGDHSIHRCHNRALLHSAAGEKSAVALRESIIEDAGHTPAQPITGERTARR